MATAALSQPQRTIGGGIGSYKDISVSSINHKNEIEGTAKYGPASYPNYLPVWDNEKGEKYPALTPFKHQEHGKDADFSFPNLLGKGTVVDNITSSIGAEVHGVQLSQLNNAGKDELALFVAQKKVVAFRDQDFADLPIQKAIDFAAYFGRLHIHPASGAPKDHPEVHLVHRGAEDTSFANFLQERTNSVAWHSDVTYELQPPGTTFLYALDVPTSGGDTLFANMVKAYERLSPAFQERLADLKALHSGFEQAQSSWARGGVYRRDPVQSIHPIGKHQIRTRFQLSLMLASSDSSRHRRESIVRQSTVHEVHYWIQEGGE